MTFTEYIKELLQRPKPHGVPKGYLLVKRSYLEKFYAELEAAQQLRALDFAETCTQKNHFYVDGSCAHCGSKDPQSQ